MKTLKPIPLAEVEARANALRQRCVRELNLFGLPLPVPVDLWVERPLGFDFGVEDLAHLGSDVLGAAYVKEKAIKVSSTIALDARYRFTIAHELGHMTLHTDVDVLFRDAEEAPGTRPRYELEADRFAAAFLMPQDEFLRAISIVGERAGFEALQLFERDANWDQTLPLWREKVVPFLQARFGVSYAAAAFRLSELTLSEGSLLLNRKLVEAIVSR